MDVIKGTKGGESKDSSSKESDETIIKPFTTNNVLYYYCPIIGTASYTLLSMTVMHPTLWESVSNERVVINVLLVNSLIGGGCYVYSRDHLKSIPTSSRLGYSALGSLMFSFGSVLMWALLGICLPRNSVFAAVVGGSTSFIMLKGATNYLKLVDSQDSK